MTSAAPILVCFAVREEAGHFTRLAGSRPGVRILLTGMGRRNAETALAAALQEGRPRLVISAGFAGALLPDLTRGEVVFDVDKETVLEAGLRAAGARPVRFHCAERVVTTVEEKRALRAASGAEAVEMESGFIRLLCEKEAIPAGIVRVILDTAEEDLVLDFNPLMTDDQRIDGPKLALALLKAPWKIPGLLTFQKQSAAAARRLGETLAQVLGFEPGCANKA
jgi:adenosylhomocysteine nucleosidase